MGFLRDLKSRGLRGTQLFIGDKCSLAGSSSTRFTLMLVIEGRQLVDFTCNVLSVVPRGKMKVAAMLRAIHAQEDRQAAIAKSQDVIARLGK